MKTALLSLIAIAVLPCTALSDSPAAISADYRTKAAAALDRVNSTLETATVPLVAALVKSGDTAGAEELQQQLKAKTSGEPVLKPQATATALFKLYDAARSRALDPVQQSAITRIEAMLASSDGKKLEVVAELGKVRAEVEAGKAVDVINDLPVKWSYHMKSDIGPSGTMIFNPTGEVELWIIGRKTATFGTWKHTKIPGQYAITMTGETFALIVNGTTAEMDMPNVGKRYLKALAQVSN